VEKNKAEADEGDKAGERKQLVAKFHNAMRRVGAGIGAPVSVAEFMVGSGSAA
jgi:hypothetical protein